MLHLTRESCSFPRQTRTAYDRVRLGQFHAASERADAARVTHPHPTTAPGGYEQRTVHFHPSPVYCVSARANKTRTRVRCSIYVVCGYLVRGTGRIICHIPLSPTPSCFISAGASDPSPSKALVASAAFPTSQCFDSLFSNIHRILVPAAETALRSRPLVETAPPWPTQIRKVDRLMRCF